MAKNPEDTLIDTIKTKKDNDLTLTGKHVLAQNNQGIFYGKLEKINTRDSAALLSNGYMISPEKYVTFVQSLRLSRQNEKNHSVSKSGNKYTVHSYETIKSIAMQNCITDYATSGIAPYNVIPDASYLDLDENEMMHFADDFTVSLISLTGITVIVPISEDSFITDLSEDTEISVEVISTFNGDLFAPHIPTVNLSEKELEEYSKKTSVFGTSGVRDLVAVRKEKSND